MTAMATRPRTTPNAIANVRFLLFAAFAAAAAALAAGPEEEDDAALSETLDLVRVEEDALVFEDSDEVLEAVVEVERVVGELEL